MQALRPKLSPRYTGYVCSSCIVKLRAPNPLLRRPVTTQTTFDGHPKKTRLQKAKETTPDASDKVVIRRFDESPDGDIRPSGQDLEHLEELVEARIKSLEAELKGLKTREYGSQQGRRDEITGDDVIIQNSRQQTLLRKLSFSPDRGMEIAEKPDEPVLQNVTISLQEFPQNSRLPIIYLNRQLEIAAVNHTATDAMELWRRYSRCRRTLMSGIEHIPDNTWKVLWMTLAAESPKNLDRMSHIKKIGKDMETAGLTLDAEQLLLYIEASFVHGAHDQAIQRWESSRTILTANSSAESQYWSLGVRMFAHHNCPQEAQYAANVLLNQIQGEKDARVLIPLMASWLSSTDQRAVQHAWAMYIRLRVHLGSKMVMEDYDACVGVFMTAQRTDLALAVFRDMMLRSQSPESLKPSESLNLYKAHLRINSDLRTMELEPAELTWTGYPPFLALPKTMQNKFFYGSWIKKLLGEGEVDWAAKAVDFMYGRNVGYNIQPDPMHVNGIIGAWLRSGTSSNERKAEEMAWRMIDSRMNIVRIRLQRKTYNQNIQMVLSTQKPDFIRPLDDLPIAPASLETFSLLAEYYRLRTKPDQVFELYGTMRAAKIKPTTYFMNILLNTAEMVGKKTWAWSLYEELVTMGYLVPNMATFEPLWKIMKDHVDPAKNKTKAGYPTCRFLFSEVVKWAGCFQRKEFSRTLYNRIILSFGLDDDPIGLGITLRAMQVLFQVYPDDKAVRLIIVTLAQARIVDERGIPTPRENLKKQTRDRISTIGQLLKVFKEERAAMLQSQGIDYDALKGDAKSEEIILLLCDVLRCVIHARTRPHNALRESDFRINGDNGKFQELAEHAAELMGIPQTMALPWTSTVRQLSGYNCSSH